MKTLAALVGVFAVAGFGFAQSLFVSPAAIPKTQSTTVQPFQAGSGAFVQTSPGANPTSIVHVGVSGTPNSGTFVAGQVLGASQTHTAWLAEFRQGPIESTTRYVVWVTRDVASDLSVHWRGGVTYGTIGSNSGGAYTGYPDGAGGLIGNTIPLNGPDFNVSGTGQFVGNPAYGGGSNVTITVTP